MFFTEDVMFLKEVNDWCNLDEQTQEKEAEKYDWGWYFEWFDEGNYLFNAYSKDNPNEDKFKILDAYDGWEKEPIIRSSNVFLGIDARFHEADKPVHTWKEWQPCENKSCKYCNENNDDECGFFGSNERMYDCFGEMFALLQMVTDLCGYSGLHKVQNKLKIHSDIIGWFIYRKKYFEPTMESKRRYNRFVDDLANEYQLNRIDAELYYDENYNNMEDEEYIYEDGQIIKRNKTTKQRSDKMKPFIKAFNELDKAEPKDISVYWDGGLMRVEDQNDNQATISTDLFNAYLFALYIKTPVFDYVADDETVKEFQKQLIKFGKECDNLEDKYYVDVWKYLDDIAEDFEKLTGKTINDIDYKRMIVAYMSDTSEDECGMGFGSATYIARLLSDHIIGNERNNIAKCNNPLTIELANKYLQTDNYDIIKFAEELHKECQYKMKMPKDFNEYLLKASSISEKCYYLLGRLLQNNREYENDILVGYIDWFGDYEENERYIYCHIDSVKNEIYFHENREHSCKSAYLHDIAFPHLVGDPSRIQEDIIIKFTEQYIDDIVSEKMHDIYGIDDDPYFGNEWGYNYCHMYGTTGQYAL